MTFRGPASSKYIFADQHQIFTVARHIREEDTYLFSEVKVKGPQGPQRSSNILTKMSYLRNKSEQLVVETSSKNWSVGQQQQHSGDKSRMEVKGQANWKLYLENYL